MKLEFKSQVVSSKEEILDVHIEWDPSNNKDESKAALIGTFLDMVKKLYVYEKALEADGG
jgi:hypothetical protein